MFCSRFSMCLFIYLSIYKNLYSFVYGVKYLDEGTDFAALFRWFCVHQNAIELKFSIHLDSQSKQLINLLCSVHGKHWGIAFVELLDNIKIQQAICMFHCISMPLQSPGERPDIARPFDQHQHHQLHISKISSLEKDTLGLYTMYITNLDLTWRILFEHLHLKGAISDVGLELRLVDFFLWFLCLQWLLC